MPTIQIDVNDLNDQFRDAVQKAVQGEDVIVTRAGIPVARITPCEPPKREWVLGLHPGSMVMAPDFDDPLPDEFWLGES